VLTAPPAQQAQQVLMAPLAQQAQQVLLVHKDSLVP